jgi:hypothetical protein
MKAFQTLISDFRMPSCFLSSPLIVLPSIQFQPHLSTFEFFPIQFLSPFDSSLSNFFFIIIIIIYLILTISYKDLCTRYDCRPSPDGLCYSDNNLQTFTDKKSET